MRRLARAWQLLLCITPPRAARLFAVSNIAFLGGDIALAHLSNAFARPEEWAPLVFSFVATLALIPGAIGARHPAVSWLELFAGGGAVAMGVAGMLFHLQSGFFAEQTLHRLVYSAPFVAPLSYVGVGLLVLLLRTGEGNAADDAPLGAWLLVLALGGFAGNFVLSALDHAQDGFFRAAEWIPVVAAAYAIGFLVAALVLPGKGSRRACFMAMACQAIVGLVGFALHVAADLKATGGAEQPVVVPPLERFVFGAPAFAPLLFVDLAALAALGLWASAPRREP